MNSNFAASRTALRRLKVWMAFVVAGAFGFAPNASAQNARTSTPATASDAAKGPKIEFAAPIFDFGKVKQGEVVRHDFVFKNTGTATLEITGVNPGCGCTTAGNWDKRVEPGQTGTIALQFNSGGFSGNVAKAATVTSNDPRQPTVNLQVKGDVWTPFAVTPSMALFNVSSETETSETKVIRIVSQIEPAVSLTGVDGASASFRTEIETVKPGKEFELRVTAVPPFGPSSVSSSLTVKTTAAEAPTLSVLAQLIIQPPVVATPDRITLPAGPFSGVTTTTVTVRNNGTSALTLSDASVNAKGGTVTIQEVQPGKLFYLNVKFSAGFEMVPGHLTEVSVKTSHPKFPALRIPVIQPPPATRTPTSGGGQPSQNKFNART